MSAHIAKYDWATVGDKIVAEYLAGTPPVILSQTYQIPVSSITGYLGKRGCRRNGKEAKALSRAQGRINTQPKSTRVCPICQETFQPKGPNQQRCRPCIPNERFKEYYHRYGVSKRDWDRILANQNGQCALCPALPVCVDHNHETGIVRGLLCHGCNRALSQVDQLGWLPKATKYIAASDTGCRVNPKGGYWNAWRTWHDARDQRLADKRAQQEKRTHRALEISK